MTRMHKWVKRALLVVALLLAGAIVFAVGGIVLFKGTPGWYRPEELAGTPEERAAAAQRAENKLIEVRNWAELLNADAVHAQADADAQAQAAPGAAAAAAPARAATRAADSLTVAFTEKELNAFFRKWSVAYGWEAKYGRFLSDPVIELQPERLILAGKVTDAGTVASFHFRPALDARGQLRLDLAGVRGGRLPLPQAAWTPQRDKVLAALRARLPAWQRDARIDATGAANGPAIATAMAKLVFDVTTGRPGEPVLFLPLSEGHSVPVRLTAVSVDDHELTLTAQPMTDGERAALLQRIREPYDAETADSR